MVSNRRIQILAVLLAVQVIIMAFVYWPRPTQATSVPVFAALASADVTGLTISDSAGKELKLAKRGDAWVLPDAGDFPAQGATVSGLVDKLIALKTSRLVAETPASHSRLQVAGDDFVRRLDLETGKGERYTLYLGSAPNAGATHFRLGGQDRVYLANNITSFDAGIEPSGYIDTAYLSIPSADIGAIRIENKGGVLTFEQQGGKWTLAGLAAGQTLDDDAVQTLLGRVSSLAMTRPLGATADPAWGLTPPAATVTVITRPAQGEGKTYTLQIGVKDEATGSYYAKSSESPYYVQIAGATLDDFVSKGLTDFVAAPTPAGPPPSTPAP